MQLERNFQKMWMKSTGRNKSSHKKREWKIKKKDCNCRE